MVSTLRPHNRYNDIIDDQTFKYSMNHFIKFDKI